MTKKITLEEYVTTQTLISRRELLTQLHKEQVLVNEVSVNDICMQIDPDVDSVKVDGAYIEHGFSYLYYRFYKPKGMLSTMDDLKDRECLGDYIRQLQKPLKPVGRLDRQTTGLMILTNDGDLAHKLSHPSFECLKSYECVCDKPITKLDLQRLKKGIFLEDGPVVFNKVNLLNSKTVALAISEGRNRIIRRSFEFLGYQVKQLKRTKVAHLTLEGLNSGHSKELSKADVKMLKSLFSE